MTGIVVLASGNGSNAQALLDATTDGRIRGNVVAVVTDNPAARVLGRARNA
ncbi:MAG: formyltransferase family protein, partial [Acidimicrobiales bacterium]